MVAPIVAAAAALAARLAAKKTAEKAALAAAKKYALKASLVKKSLAKNGVSKAAESIAKKEVSAGDVLRTAKVEGRTQKSIVRVKTKYQTQAERNVTSPARPPREIGPQFPKKTDVTYEGKGMPVRARVARKPRPVEGPERKATAIVRAKNPRVRVSDADAKEISKELKNRPSGSRNRDIPKPGSTTLTSNEKREIRMKDTILYKKPNEPKSLQQIKDEKAAAKLARTNRLLKRPSRRKAEGPKTERQTKVIENAKKDTPRVPPHKVDVTIMRKKKWKPDTSNAGAQADEYTRPLTNSGKKGSIVRQPYKSKAEIREEGNNANTNPANWDVAGNRPKTTIEKGRGNVPQPGAITRNRSVERHRAQVAERNRQRRANQSGPSIVIKQKKRNLIRRDANGKPMRDSKGNLIVNLDRRTQRVYPKTASASTETRKQNAKVMRHRVRVAEKEVLAAEKKKAKSEFVGAKKDSRSADKASKRLKAKAKTKTRLSKTRPTGK